LDWHRREEKGVWWEYFRLRELSDDALLDEKSAIAGLRHVGRVGATRRGLVDRYSFPPQETSIRRGKTLKVGLPDEQDFGKVAGIDLRARTLDVEKTGSRVALHPTSAFIHERFPPGVLADSLLRLGRWVAGNGVDAPWRHRAACDLLMGRAP